MLEQKTRIKPNDGIRFRKACCCSVFIDRGGLVKSKTYLYDRYVEIVKANSKIQNPRDFHDWAMRNYFDSALMCVRRLVKVQRRDGKIENISLKGLLEEMRDYPELITCDFYLRNYPLGSTDKSGFPNTEALTRAFGEKTFKDSFSGGGTTLLASVVEADILELEKQTKVVESFIDNTLAHKQKGSKGNQALKTADARKAIETIEKIAVKYLNVMGRGGYVDGLTPVYQYDPEVVFLEPWIKR